MGKERRIPYRGYLSVGLGLILLMVYISITHGTYEIPLKDVVKTLLRINPNPKYDLVILQFRLPRILIALLVGLGLGVAGTVVQAITKNPLADPGILGINAGAGAAIIIFIYFYQGAINTTAWVTSFSMPFFGLIGGLGAALLIYLMAWKNGRMDSQRLVLCGIAIGSGLSALSLFFSMTMNAGDFEMARVWTNGSLWNANYRSILAMIPWLVSLIPVIMKRSHVLDLFQLEESTVTSLGVETEREKAVLLLAAIGLISASVSVSGSIAFLGLLAPHIARGLVGVHHRRVIPVAGLVGMLLVLTADFIGKTFFKPVELPVGIVIALIGVPYFIYLLYQGK